MCELCTKKSKNIGISDEIGKKTLTISQSQCIIPTVSAYRFAESIQLTRQNENEKRHKDFAKIRIFTA